MRIAVFGLGYVGAVSASAFADRGHDVVGVDVNEAKVDTINDGRSPVIEAGLDALLRRGVLAGRIHATTHADEAIASSDISFVCVGTPSLPNGDLDLTQVEKVCHEIGLALAARSTPHTVVVRSTMLPGSCEGVVIPALEAASGRRVGNDLAVCVNPEFLREGVSLRDFAKPPFTLIGTSDARDAEPVAALYASTDAPTIVTSFAEAEMVKYVSNAFHALKVVFANEIGELCKRQGLDGRVVMDVMCQDTKLNISPAYLRPGFAFGGSCLPKDLRALTYRARRLDVDAPMLSAIIPSNRAQVERVVEMLRRIGRTRVGVVGLSFKAGTDDLRESPVVELIERLLGKGYAVRVHDAWVSLANLVGTNRAYIEREIPHVASLLVDEIETLVDESDVLVIANGSDAAPAALERARPDQPVIDLTGIGAPTRARYEGVAW